MQDLSALDSQDGFFLNTLLRVSRKSISSFISFALIIIDPEIISGELLSPINLFRAQVFYIHKIVQVVMVH